MKHIVLYFFLITASVNMQAQTVESSLHTIANTLSIRNAKLLGADSLYTKLATVYRRIIVAAFCYRLKNSGDVTSKQLANILRTCRKEIWAITKGKVRRKYRRLWKQTGNILLLSITK